MIVAGLVILGWGGVIYRKEGAGAALEFFFAVDEEDSETTEETGSNDKTEKTPPAPQSVKDDLYFDAPTRSSNSAVILRINQKFTTFHRGGKADQTIPRISSYSAPAVMRKPIVGRYREPNSG